MRRLKAVEGKFAAAIQKKYVLRDFDGRYYGECGFGLLKEQFDAWINKQGIDVEVVIMKYITVCENPNQTALNQTFASNFQDKGNI